MKIITHSPEACRGRNCVIHNPSDHHMKDWPVVHRLDRQVELDGWDGLGLPLWPGPVFTLTERTCPCEVSHPDPDSLAYARLIGGDGFTRVQSVHGCCAQRCCVASPFNPFDRDDPRTRTISDADAEFLAQPAQPLTILVPVEIEEGESDDDADLFVDPEWLRSSINRPRRCGGLPTGGLRIRRDPEPDDPEPPLGPWPPVPRSGYGSAG